MNRYYIAIRGCEPIPVIFKTNLTQSKIDCYIQQYGLDFIGIYNNILECKQAIELNNYLFNDPYFTQDLIDTINHLERCYQLEYKEV